MESDNAEIETGGNGDANRLTMNEGSAAHVHPLDICPAEVWLDIFQWLEAPQDLLNLVNTCTTFEYLLEAGSFNTPGAGKVVCQLMEVLPLVMNYLGKGDILNLRASCMRISRSVDKALSETCHYDNLHVHPWLLPRFDQMHLREFPFEQRNLKLSIDEHPCLVLDSVEKIDEVTAELESRRNPQCQRGPRMVGNRVIIRLFWAPYRGRDDRIVYDDEAEGEFDANLSEEDDELDLETNDSLGEYQVEEGAEVDNSHVEEREENDLADREDVPNRNGDHDEDSDAEEEEDGIPPAVLPDLSDLRNPYVRNPILRYIRLAAPAILRQREFLEHVLLFLRKFPNQVRGLIFQLTLDYQTRMYQMIQDAITSLPNIETLEVHICCHRPLSTPEVPSDVKALKMLIKASPLPSAPKLKRLHLQSYHQWPETFLQEIGKRYGEHLLELIISVSQDDDFDSDEIDVEVPMQIEPAVFPSLRSLCIYVYSWYLLIFPSLKAPQLRTLTVSGTLTYRFDKTAKAIQLINMLRRYPMLRKYSLELDRSHVKSLDEALELLRSTDFRHSNLRTVIIRMAYDRNMPLSFFPRLCPNLRFMIYDEDVEYREPTKDHDLKLLRSRHMQQSTLWQICPDLLMIRHLRFGYDPEDQEEMENSVRRVYASYRSRI